MKCWIALLMGVVLSVEASMESAYAEGRAFAESLSLKNKNIATQIDVKKVPGFETAAPKEANLDGNSNFEEALHQALETNKAANQVIENSKTRPRFKIDPKTDPRFQVDLGSSEKNMGIDPKNLQKQDADFVEKICEEGGEAVRYECFENRVVVPRIVSQEATLSVNHLSFSPNMKSRTVTYKKGWHHGTRGESYQEGWTLRLPQEINAFKAEFCPKFQAKDIKTGQVFNIDCARIQRYEIKEASLSQANGVWNIVVPEACLKMTLHYDVHEGEAIDELESNCAPLEKMVEEGLCSYVDRVVSQGPARHTIQGYPIDKDAWQYKQIYECQLIKDECSGLRAQGCIQVGSTCKEKKQDRCWIFEQRYRCPSQDRRLDPVKRPPLSAFCLTGDCHQTDYQANDQMLEVISRLSALKEIQDDRRKNKAENLNIFKGEVGQCTRHCLSFKDCCKHLKGWGVSLKLAHCDSEDRALAEKRAKHLCHEVGTYCAEWGKIPPFRKKCLRKKSTFCCFGSRLARLLQVEGRKQLGFSWGAAESPACRGLSVQELSRLDLSKMDFSELFEEVMKKYRTPHPEALQQKTNVAIQERLKQVQQGIESNRSTTGTVNVHQNAL